MKRIYMDCASTTPVDKDALKEMLPFFTQKYGNASSPHSFGREAHAAMGKAREKVASLINADKEEIFFTSGGTESDNLAIKGIAYRMKKYRNYKGPHIITSRIEHPAVLETCRHLEKIGFKVKYLPVDKYGIVSADELKNSISKGTFLISIMHANNEIGTIQNIDEIGKIAKEHNIVFHSDTVQSVGKIPVDVKKTKIEMLSMSSHKIYGPKGVGAAYIRKGTKLESIVHGGGHEKNLRSGTENIPGIVGFGKACEIAKKCLEKEKKRITKLRDRLIKSCLEIPNSMLNGPPVKRLPGNTNFLFENVNGESIVTYLDLNNVAASTGSACSSKKIVPSHVLTAIGLNNKQAFSCLRLTLGRKNNKEEVGYVVKVLLKGIRKLRGIAH